VCVAPCVQNNGRVAAMRSVPLSPEGVRVLPLGRSGSDTNITGMFLLRFVFSANHRSTELKCGASCRSVSRQSNEQRHGFIMKKETYHFSNSSQFVSLWIIMSGQLMWNHLAGKGGAYFNFSI